LSLKLHFRFVCHQYSQLSSAAASALEHQKEAAAAAAKAAEIEASQSSAAAVLAFKTEIRLLTQEVVSRHFQPLCFVTLVIQVFNLQVENRKLLEQQQVHLQAP
jgi:hypothetical protein